MKTFLLVLQEADAQYSAALHTEDPVADPLASHTFAADVAAIASSFRATAEGDPLLNIGQELYDLVEPALAPYLAARDEDEPTQLLLKIHDPGLNSLPWELLLNNKQPLFRNPKFPMCRLQPQELGSFDRLKAHDWPLRIFIVVGSEEDDKAVDASDEVAQLVDVLVPYEAAIDWQVMVRPDHEQLLNALARFKPHIFHFIGHGAINEDGDEPVAFLRIFNQQTGENHDWNADIVSDDLRRKGIDSLRLAFINACRSSEDVGEDGLWSLTDAFLDAGAVAVIGTRAEIRGSAAARCAATFYREFVKDNAIDVAMARARAEISGLKLRDWATMSLELRLPPLDVFLSCIEVHPKPKWIRRKYWEVCKFVGRQDIYRSAWQARLAEEKRPAVITGPTDAGKTSAATMLLERCLLANHVARYVDADKIARTDKKALDYVDLMRAMLEGVDDDNQFPHSEPFPDARLDEFYALLETTLGDNLDNRTIQNVRKLFRGFRAIIEKTFPDKPILLVFDHLSHVENESLKIAIRYFKRWHDDGARVQTLLIIEPHKERQLQDSGLDISEPDFTVLTLNPFPQDSFPDLASEFTRRLVIAGQVRTDKPLAQTTRTQYMESVQLLVKQVPAKPWVPKTLARLEDVFIDFGWLPKEYSSSRRES